MHHLFGNMATFSLIFVGEYCLCLIESRKPKAESWWKSENGCAMWVMCYLLKTLKPFEFYSGVFIILLKMKETSDSEFQKIYFQKNRSFRARDTFTRKLWKKVHSVKYHQKINLKFEEGKKNTELVSSVEPSNAMCTFCRPTLSRWRPRVM